MVPRHSPKPTDLAAKDGYGRLRTATDADNYTITYDYDALDRVSRATYPDGTYEETVYNRLDAEKRRDRLGRWRHVFYDPLRRPVASRDALGRTATQQWCNCGSLDKIVDAQGNAITWERDLHGRVTREVRADGSDTEFIYEAATSRLKQVKDAKDQVREYQYFLDGTLKQVSYPSAVIPTATVSFTYDGSHRRVATRQDGVGTTTYACNPIGTPPSLGAGRLASIDGPLANDATTYTYDELGRALTQAINGIGVSQTYDALGRIDTESNPLGSFSYGYSGTTGRLTSVSYPNGQTTTFDYLDNLGDHRLKEIHNKLPGGATLSKFTYASDASGRFNSWTQQMGAGAPVIYEYGYDPVDQLSSATLKATTPPSVLKSYAYGYDKAGNRTVESIDSAVVAAGFNNVNRLQSHQVGGTLRFAGSVNEPASVTVAGSSAAVSGDNRFEGSATVSSGTNTVAVVATDPTGNVRTNTYQVSVTGSGKTFTYDLNGNLTSDVTRSFEWDGADHLVAVNQGSRRSEFTYDGDDRRVRIVEKDGAAVLSDQRFVWCGMRVCEERDSNGATVTRRFLDQGVQQGGTSYFYTIDHLGSVRELTDAAAAVRARYDYDPYGRMTKVSGDKDTSFGFTGHYVHGPTALSLATYRAYDASLGRWVSEDPIGLRGRDLNLYGYVANSPVNAVDPTGEIAIPIAVGFVTLAVLTTMLIIHTIQHPPPVPPWPTPLDPPPTVPPSTPVTPAPPNPPTATTATGGGSTTTTMAPPTPAPPPPLLPLPDPPQPDCDGKYDCGKVRAYCLALAQRAKATTSGGVIMTKRQFYENCVKSRGCEP